ncbi:MAG: RNA polymerase sigma factor [Candidatus Cryosericum sp.]
MSIHQDSSVARMHSDSQLILHAAAGDETAFQTLFQRYRGFVAGYLQRRLPAMLQNDLDDVLQDVFLCFYHALPRFLPDTFVTRYLLKTADRQVVDHIRKAVGRRKHDCHRTYPLLLDAGRTADAITDHRAADQQEATQRVDDVLHRLHPTQSDVVRLCDLEGHTLASAAALLHIPTTTAAWRHKAAWAKLRRLRRLAS